MEDLKKYAPEFKHVNDSVAFVVHLSFLSQKCKLVGLRDEQYLEDIGSIPQGWNKSHEIYVFRYIADKAAQPKGKAENEEKKSDEQRNTILVKILAMEENELLITAVRQGSDDVLTLEISVKDHIDTEKCKDLTDYAALFRDIDGLHILLNDQITHKVIPRHKHKQAEKEDAQNEKKRQKPYPNPLIYQDPNDPNPNPLLIGGGRRPFGGGNDYGRDDLDPFGGGGGNLMGPNQIGQQWRNQNNPNNPNANRPPFVPPNARFDPFGPGGMGPGPDHFKPPDQGNGNGFGGGGFGGGFGNGGGGGFGGG